MNLLKPPCDEGVMSAKRSASSCGKAQGRWILAATILGSSMSFIDGTVVNVALPALQANLNATAIDVQWVVESYALFLAALLLLGGSLGDHFGRKRIYAIGVALFALASMWCGLAPNVGQLILARAVQGLGGALFVYGLIESSRLGFHSPVVIVALSSSLIFLFAFVIVEARRRHPMMPLTLFRARNFTGANLLTLFLYAALAGTLFFLPLNLIQVQGYSATAAGASSLPFILIMFLLSRWSGGLVKRYGSRLPLVIGPIIAAIGFALFMRPGVGDSYWTTFFPAVVVLGLGMAISVAPLTTTVMNSVKETHAGIASGVNNAVSRTAGLLAIAVLGLIMFQTFNRCLDQRLSQLAVPVEIREAVNSQRIKLAAAEIPSAAEPMRAAIKQAIDECFVCGFRRVMLVGCGLALSRSLMAWLIIRSR